MNKLLLGAVLGTCLTASAYALTDADINRWNKLPTEFDNPDACVRSMYVIQCSYEAMSELPKEGWVTFINEKIGDVDVAVMAVSGTIATTYLDEQYKTSMPLIMYVLENATLLGNITKELGARGYNKFAYKDVITKSVNRCYEYHGLNADPDHVAKVYKGIKDRGPAVWTWDYVNSLFKNKNK